MRQTYIIWILISLLLTIECTSLSDKYPIFKSRKSLLSTMTTIETKMTLKAPLEEIAKLIIDYRNEINSEQQNQYQLYQQQTKECEDEMHFRLNEIAASTDASNKADFALNACNAQHERAEGDLSNVKNQIQETQNYIAQLIATRQQQSDDFESARESYNFNSKASDEAVQMLEQIWSGEASFIQLAHHANQMLIHAISIKKVHKLTPVMAALAQLANKKLIADDTLISNVIYLLRDFRNTIENDFKTLQKQENESIQLFQANRTRTEDFLATLIQSKTALEEEISKLNICINNQSSILQTANAKLQRNNALLESASNMCSSFNKEYESATQARNQELELIDMITEKCEARYNSLSEYIKERTQQNSFDNHINDSSEEIRYYKPSQNQSQQYL